jgi:hypothetical protein
MRTRSISVRALVGGLAVASAVAGLAVSVPGPAQAASRTPWHVTIAVARTTVTLGQKVRITGRVDRAAAGRLVRLYERGSAGRRWRYQRNALVHRDGGYTTYDRPSVNRRRQYRVVVPATHRHRKGVSATIVVDVYRWTTLTTLASVNDVDFDPTASVAMDGTGYPASLEAHVQHYPGAPTTQSIELNLDHACTRFRGVFGLSDDSMTGSGATVTAAADGTAWFSRTFRVGQSEPNAVTWDVAPLKIRFASVSTVSDADGSGAVGTPQVYCEQP